MLVRSLYILKGVSHPWMTVCCCMITGSLAGMALKKENGCNYCAVSTVQKDLIWYILHVVIYKEKGTRLWTTEEKN